MMAKAKLEADTKLKVKTPPSVPASAVETLPPPELPIPVIPAPSEDKNILPKPATPVVLKKSEMAPLPALNDAPADKPAASAALP